MQHIVIDPSGALPSALQAFLVPDEPEAIGLAIEALIQRPDEAGGDPDLERDDSDLELSGDELGDPAWIEQVNQARKSRRVDGWFGTTLPHEDAEEGDTASESTDDEPGFDVRSRKLANRRGSGPGCVISDPDLEHDGREPEHDAGDCRGEWC